MIVLSHHSYNTTSKLSELFRNMFPDSEMATKFQLGLTKLAYLICLRITPYFCDKLIDEICSSVCYVISFDESLNHSLKKEQMDFVIHYVSGNEVVTRYLGSEFLGHTTANDLLKDSRQEKLS